MPVVLGVDTEIRHAIGVFGGEQFEAIFAEGLGVEKGEDGWIEFSGITIEW